MVAPAAIEASVYVITGVPLKHCVVELAVKSAVVGQLLRFILIVLEELAQEPLLIVHWNVAESPIAKLVTVDVGLPDAVTEIAPLVVETIDHAPVPNAGVFPASVATPGQICWLGPATDAVGV